MTDPSTLRAALAGELSAMYADEVPKYGHLVDATARVNAQQGQEHVDAARLGTERHGAIRVASFDELRQIARLFAQFGMAAVGYYDLRSSPTPIPVVSTAFRPLTAAELTASPFRMFTSTLVADDERFFDAELQRELAARQASRGLLGDELTALIDEAEAGGRVDDPEQFVALSVDAFRLDLEPIDRSWFERLDAISPVASDIAAGPNTHLNHLTPRVADIDLLHQTMEAEGVEMIDRIQGPPAWSGPDLLLRQTSFRALDEQRTFVDADGRHSTDDVRVRFGEVEQRGIAVTPQGRAKVDAAMSAGADAGSEDERLTAVREALESSLAATVEGLHQEGDIYVRYVAAPDGDVAVEPITYEDFLPASAAGIFASNLAHTGTSVGDTSLRRRDFDRLRDAVGELHDPYALYQAEQERTFTAVDATGG